MSDAKTDEQETIDRLRKRLLDTRERLWELEDRHDTLRDTMKRTAAIKGPEYTARTACNDGRVWARPRAEAREDWVRVFAANGLCNPEAGNVVNVVEDAFNVWSQLEARFEAERIAEISEGEE